MGLFWVHWASQRCLFVLTHPCRLCSPVHECTTPSLPHSSLFPLYERQLLFLIDTHLQRCEVLRSQRRSIFNVVLSFTCLAVVLLPLSSARKNCGTDLKKLKRKSDFCFSRFTLLFFCLILCKLVSIKNWFKKWPVFVITLFFSPQQGSHTAEFHWLKNVASYTLHTFLFN